MSKFEYEWWTVNAIEATGKITWVVKAKNKDNAIKQIKKMAVDHDKEVQVHRPDFKTEILWDTLFLDHKGYQRLF